MDPFGDALLAVQLLKRDPAGLGGIILRGGGPARDALIAALGPMRRLPIGIDDEALIGGRDLAATLAGRGGGQYVRVCWRRLMAACWWSRWPNAWLMRSQRGSLR